jgi:hypothetical protein
MAQHLEKFRMSNDSRAPTREFAAAALEDIDMPADAAQQMRGERPPIEPPMTAAPCFVLVGAAAALKTQ